MLPEYIAFLSRIDAFYKLLVEQVKTKTINEAEFYMLLGVKCKAMKRERVLLNKETKQRDIEIRK